MKKIGLAALVVSGLIAQDSGYYVGADVGRSYVTAKGYAFGVNVEVSEEEIAETLKAGYYLDQSSRVAAFIQRINLNGTKTYLYGFGYDYLIGSDKLKPFVGLFAGYGSLKNASTNVSGRLIGAQAGVNYSFNDYFSMEAGFRFIKTEMEDTLKGSEYDITIKLEEMTNWFVGVNYKF